MTQGFGSRRSTSGVRGDRDRSENDRLRDDIAQTKCLVLAVTVTNGPSYRHWGESEGEPRRWISIRRQLEDWRAAVAYARGLEAVDPQRIALWGMSLGGGHALMTAAGDPRLAAVVALMPVADGVALWLKPSPASVAVRSGWRAVPARSARGPHPRAGARPARRARRDGASARHRKTAAQAARGEHVRHPIDPCEWFWPEHIARVARRRARLPTSPPARRRNTGAVHAGAASYPHLRVPLSRQRRGCCFRTGNERVVGRGIDDCSGRRLSLKGAGDDLAVDGGWPVVMSVRRERRCDVVGARSGPHGRELMAVNLGEVVGHHQ